MIDGKTKVCGLIGNPVEHTLSPLIHSTLAQYAGINLAYVPFLVERGCVKTAVDGAFALNVQGLNVTVPHKTEVMGALCETDALALRIGAVNTLVRAQGGYKGYNTDMSGLYRAMQTDGVELNGCSVILLGAGGAGRAVAFLCAFKGAEKIYILNRSLDKAQRLADEVNRETGRSSLVQAYEMNCYDRIPEGTYLAIQCTSVGLHPNEDEAVIEDAAFYARIHTGVDLIYRPSETKFMKMVRAAGGTAFNGLKMLVYQGVDAFELWNDVQISEDAALKVYELLQRKFSDNE